MEIILETQETIKNHIDSILEFAENRKVWLFIGEMGAGKTTTIKSICESLLVDDEISSPTYSIVNEYFSDKLGTLYHFDCYRIESEEESLQIGIEDYFYSGYLCFVEWPDKVSELIPDEYLIFRLDKLDENTRRLTITKNV